MARISISVEAFEAIARTLPLGSVAYQAEPKERGGRYIWLARCADRASRLATLSYVSRGRRRLPRDAGKTKQPLGAG
jgi:hypothetical protein